MEDNLEKELDELSNLFLLSEEKNRELTDKLNMHRSEKRELLGEYKQSLAEAITSLTLYDNIVCELASLSTEPVLVPKYLLRPDAYAHVKIMQPPLFRRKLFKKNEEKVSTLLVRISSEDPSDKGVEFSYRPESAKHKLNKYSFSLINGLKPRDTFYRGDSTRDVTNMCAYYLEEFSEESRLEYSYLELIPEAVQKIPELFRNYYESL